jgi:hypothetical protein
VILGAACLTSRPSADATILLAPLAGTEGGAAYLVELKARIKGTADRKRFRGKSDSLNESRGFGMKWGMTFYKGADHVPHFRPKSDEV